MGSKAVDGHTLSKRYIRVPPFCRFWIRPPGPPVLSSEINTAPCVLPCLSHCVLHSRDQKVSRWRRHCCASTEHFFRLRRCFLTSESLASLCWCLETQQHHPCPVGPLVHQQTGREVEGRGIADNAHREDPNCCCSRGGPSSGCWGLCRERPSSSSVVSTSWSRNQHSRVNMPRQRPDGGGYGVG